MSIIDRIRIDRANLLAEYRFEEGSGSILQDYSGNGKLGSYVGSPTFLEGGGFTADGSSSPTKYAVGHTDFLLTAQTIYLSFAPGINSTTRYHPIMGNSSGLTNLNITLSDITNNAQFHAPQVYGGSGPGVGGLCYCYDVIPNTPAIVAIVIDGSNVAQTKIYIEGKEVGAYITRALNVSLGRVGTPWFGGTNNGASSGVFTGNIYFAASYSTQHTAAQIAKNTNIIRNILNNRSNPKPDVFTSGSNASVNSQIVALGSSTTFGTNSTPYLSLLSTRLTFDRWIKGWPGGVNELSYASYGLAKYHYNPSGSFNIAILQFGGNVTTSRNLYRAVFESILMTVKNFKSQGWQVLVQTVIDRGDATGLSVPGYFNAINGLIRANFEFDEIVDIAADPRFGVIGASSNVTYYNVDLIHLNATGQQILADMYSAAINRLTNYPGNHGILFVQNNNVTVSNTIVETETIGTSVAIGEMNNVSIMGNTTNGSPTIATSQGSAFCVIGQLVTGSGIPAGTTIISISFNVSITLSANATITASNVPLVVSKPASKKHFFRVGETIRVTQKGLLTTNGASQTLNKKLIYNGSTIASTGVVTLPTSLSAASYIFEVELTPLTLGLTGAFRVVGILRVYDGVGGESIYPIASSGTTAIDTTVDAIWSITDTWGAANPSNIDVANYLLIKRIKS